MIVLAVGMDCISKKRKEAKIVLNKAKINDEKKNK